VFTQHISQSDNFNR